MAGLTQDRKTDQAGTPDAPLPQLLVFAVKAATKIYAGAIVCTDATGLAVPGSVSTTQIPWGRARRFVDNSAGADAATVVLVEPGYFWFDNGTAGDAIARANIGALCYITDDHTANLTNGTSTRSQLGVIVGIAADWAGAPVGQILVAVGPLGQAKW